MEKRKYVASTLECSIEIVNGEECMKLAFKGRSHKKYINGDFSDRSNVIEMFVPLFAVPYTLIAQRRAVAKYEADCLDKINRLKQAYNTEV